MYTRQPVAIHSLPRSGIGFASPYFTQSQLHAASGGTGSTSLWTLGQGAVWPAMDHPSGSQYPEQSRQLSPQTSYSSESEMKAAMSQPGAKARPSRAGTRSVSSLSPAQLERKRANDREAQRAIRQRTKDHIESLERKIAELTSTDETGSKLIHALNRVDELEQENALLRARLVQPEQYAAGDEAMTGESSMASQSTQSSMSRLSHVGHSQMATASTPRIPGVLPAGTQPEQWQSPHTAAVMPNIGSTAGLMHGDTQQQHHAAAAAVAAGAAWAAPPSAQGMQRTMTHQDSAQSGMHQVAPAISPQGPHGGYSYMIDSAGRPQHFPSADDAPMSGYDATGHQQYAQQGYTPRSMVPEAAGYQAYQTHHAYAQGQQAQEQQASQQQSQQQQQQQQASGSSHTMYINRPS